MKSSSMQVNCSQRLSLLIRWDPYVNDERILYDNGEVASTFNSYGNWSGESVSSKKRSNGIACKNLPVLEVAKTCGASASLPLPEKEHQIKQQHCTSLQCKTNNIICVTLYEAHDMLKEVGTI